MKFMGTRRAETFDKPLTRQTSQDLIGALTQRESFIGIAVGQRSHIEGAERGDFGGALNDVGEIGEELPHRLCLFEAALGVRPETPSRLAQGNAKAKAFKNILEPFALNGMKENVIRRHYGDVDFTRQRGNRARPRAIARPTMTRHLDKERVAEGLPQSEKLPPDRRDLAPTKQPQETTPRPPGEDDPMRPPSVAHLRLGQRERPLSDTPSPTGDERRELGPPRPIPREDDQSIAWLTSIGTSQTARIASITVPCRDRITSPPIAGDRVELEFGSIDQPRRARDQRTVHRIALTAFMGRQDLAPRFPGPHHPINPREIRDRQRREPQGPRLGHELVGMRGPREEAKVRPAMKLRVGHGSDASFIDGTLAPLPFRDAARHLSSRSIETGPRSIKIGLEEGPATIVEDPELAPIVEGHDLIATRKAIFSPPRARDLIGAPARHDAPPGRL